MLHDPRVRVVSFTGSTGSAASCCQAADNVLNAAMELGGNAPFIVFEDADIDAAIDGAMIAKMRNIGEACTAANRFYVHGMHDEFARGSPPRWRRSRWATASTTVWRSARWSSEGRDKMVDWSRTRSARARRSWSAASRRRHGFLLSADGLSDVPDDAKMLKEEIFGPVAPLADLHDEDEVDRAGQRHRIRPGRLCLHHDLGRGMRVSEKLDSGMIGLNRGLVSDPAAPFGGMKQSRHRPRRRARGPDGVPRDPVHRGRTGSIEVGKAKESAICLTGISVRLSNAFPVK